MPRLDPEDLRAYANRDWGAPERLSRPERVRAPVAEKVRIALALYESTRALRPEWPTAEDRRTDLESHIRLRALLRRAAHVGAR